MVVRKRRFGFNQRSRSARIEQLEDRRLLVAEGSAFELSRSFDTTGLAGELSSTIRWGDGTETTGNVNGSIDANGPLRIRFQYEGNFFNGANFGRRAILESVADSIIERFSDDLEAITPTNLLQWEAVTTNPVTGATLRIPNLSVAENEITIFVGARDLEGNRVGEAGPGTFAFAPFAGTPQQIAEVEAFRDTVQFRGETGARGANPTDVGPWGGFIAFDSLTNWHFGGSDEGLEDDEIDFASVAAHELLHVLGFGVVFSGAVNSSWETNVTGNVFTGANASAVHGGNVPLEGIDHFSSNIVSRGQQSLVAPTIPLGEQLILTPLDLAALDDIGWTVRDSQEALVTASYIYGDNPTSGTTFPVEVVLRGSELGSITTSLTSTVTNVAPTLAVRGDQAVQVGQPISLVDIGSISDPGFRNNNADPATEETFDYVIDWGDGTQNDTGTATIDRQGAPGLATLASFNGAHTYETPGVFTVTVTATDDDGGSDVETIEVIVNAPPVLSLTVSQGSVAESDGTNAATLTINRSGPVSTSAQVINLVSSDISEAVVPATAVIAAGETSVDVAIRAVDDSLLDGTQTVTFAASAGGIETGTQDFLVLDAESITASIAVDSVREDQPNVARLVVTRSNTDTDNPLTVNVSGGDSSQLQVANSITIPSGAQSASVDLVPVDDTDHELSINLSYTVTASGYFDGAASIALLDDEPPLFQNQTNQFDVDDNTNNTALDALLVINLLASRDSAQLDPGVDSFADVFPDVNGDYLITALDALLVINELSRSAESEFVANGESVSFTGDHDTALLNALADLDDEEDEILYFGFDEPTLS